MILHHVPQRDVCNNVKNQGFVRNGPGINQQISQMGLDFASEKTTQLLAVRSNQPQVKSQKSKYPSERKKLTQQLNHYRWLESRVFVTRLPPQLCQKWSDFGSVKTKMTHCTLLSMQSLLVDIFGPILIESFSLEEIKLENLLLACSQNTFFNITLRNQKMGSQILYMF